MCTARRDRMRSQAGFSLIESIITIVLAAVGILALFAALSTIFLSSNANRRMVLAGNEATTAAEAARRLTYVNCETSTAMRNRLLNGPNPVYVPPTGYSVATFTVEHLKSATDSPAEFHPEGTSCTTDHGIQRVTVEVASPGSPTITETVRLNKRRDVCPVLIGPVPGQRC